eukprot:371875-Rhodomonas_salina.1
MRVLVTSYATGVCTRCATGHVLPTLLAHALATVLSCVLATLSAYAHCVRCYADVRYGASPGGGGGRGLACPVGAGSVTSARGNVTTTRGNVPCRRGCCDLCGGVPLPVLDGFREQSNVGLERTITWVRSVTWVWGVVGGWCRRGETCARRRRSGA